MRGFIPLAIECVVLDTAPASSTQAPAAAADVSGIDCGFITAYADRVDDSVAGISAQSTAVVVGTVTAVGPATQVLPANASIMQRRSPWRVVREVTVSVRDTVKGATATSETFLVPGGTIGCVTFQIAGLADPKPGADFADHGLPERALSLRATEVWNVINGRIATPADGTVDLSTFDQLAGGKG